MPFSNIKDKSQWEEVRLIDFVKRRDQAAHRAISSRGSLEQNYGTEAIMTFYELTEVAPVRELTESELCEVSGGRTNVAISNRLRHSNLVQNNGNNVVLISIA